MGLNAIGGMELTPQVVSGSITGTAASTASVTTFGMMLGYFNFTLSGTWTSATLQLQKSFDGGSSFLPVSISSAGAPANYTANVTVTIYEPEPGVYYRVQPTVALGSGTVNYRISGGDRVT